MPSPAYEIAHCIVCGHAEANVVAEHDDIRAEMESLWAYHTRRLDANTPPTALVDRVAFSEHPPFRLVQCVDCGLVYRNPMERAHELSALYAEADTPNATLRALHDNQLAIARRQARHVRRLLGRGGSGLEVGSYVGSFLSAARHEGLNVEGLDINPCVNSFVREMGFAVHDGSLATFDAERTFDFVAIWNTFDQLADPRGAVTTARSLIAPGGLLAIRIPNGECYVANRAASADANSLRRASSRALLAQNNLLGFPYRWGFTVESLRRLVEAVGFSVEDVIGDALTRTADRWTKAWARAEERIVKAWITARSRSNPRRAPWIELYARRG